MTGVGPVLLLLRSLEHGGAQTQAVLLAKTLHGRGEAVEVALFYGGGPLAEDLLTHGIAVHDLGKRGPLDMLGFGKRLTALLRAQQPRVLYSMLSVANIAAVLAGRGAKIPRIVCGVRASNVPPRYGLKHRTAALLERWCLKRADAVIANSHAALSSMAKGLPAHVVSVVPNGFDTLRFKPDAEIRKAARTAWGLDEQTAVVGMVAARLDPMKGHDVFLNACARLSLKPVLIGAAPPDVDAVVVSATAHPEALLPGLDVLVLASRDGEGTPNVVGEAMACGLPVVVTDVGDAARLAGADNLSCPPDDATALAAAIHRVLSMTPEARGTLGARNRARIEAHFSADALAAATLAVLDG